MVWLQIVGVSDDPYYQKLNPRLFSLQPLKIRIDRCYTHEKPLVNLFDGTYIECGM